MPPAVTYPEPGAVRLTPRDGARIGGRRRRGASAGPPVVGDVTVGTEV